MKKLLAIGVLLVGITCLAIYGLTNSGADKEDAPRVGQRNSPAPAQVENEEKMARDVAFISGSRKTIADSYTQLVASANAGNPYAAFQLFQDASRCENMALRRNAMEEYAASVGDEQATSNIVGQLAEDELFCASITDEQLARKNEWVVKAARLGHIDAQLLFFGAVTEHIRTPEDIVANSEEISKHKIEALQHLRSAANRGNDTALFNMAMAYRDGTLAKRDVIAAYGYMLALRDRGTTRSADQYLRQWAQEMTADELNQAAEFSRMYNK